VFPRINHEVAIVGWGVENGTEFWKVRNSWGTYWGENGFFRIKMHSDNLAIETDCNWGVPVSEKPKADKVEIKDDQSAKGKYFKGSAIKSGVKTSVVKSALPHTYIKAADLPDSYDPRNIDGVDYTTILRNQHIPNYCGSCWSHAPTSAMSDRIKLMRNRAWPDVQLSPQVIVNCAKANQSNGCNGGDPTAAHNWIYLNGITDDSCMNYVAQTQSCVSENICRDCQPGKGCWAVPNPPKYHITEYGQVSGEANMMAEIFARGPIACTVAVPEALESYTGGIFVDKTGDLSLDHEISVVGWGAENGTKYWVVRNSWGTYWGEYGYFRLIRGINNLGVESNCDWAVPDRRDFPEAH